MRDTKVLETIRKLTASGGPLHFEAGELRLLVHVVRGLAQGRPLTRRRLERMVAALGAAPDQAERFLRRVAERDADDNIVGALGLSLKRHPHRFIVDGIPMTTWCAQDTLFLPAMLRKVAAVESESPLSGEKISLRVDPEGVREVAPAGTVMSMVVVDPDTAELGSAADIMMTFCRNIHFFAAAAEVPRWAAGRDDIVTLSLDEGYQLGRRLWPEAYAYAETLASG